MKKVIIFLVITFGLVAFFSYKLTQIPNGTNGDEGSFGYNATLLAKNLRDESNRHYPFFILAKGGKDYLQPIPTYFMAVVVKILGPSLYSIRLTSVITVVLSIILISEIIGVLFSVFLVYVQFYFLKDY